jgi:outer membrane protein OmpA-like peptidoglycan-associated protein
MQPKTPTMPAPAPAASTAAPTEQPQTGENQGQPAENAGDMSQAPGGKAAAMAPAGSPEADLERAVKDESVPLPYATKVDALTFDSGSTTLRPEATASLGTVATILEANPSARVRVEGFADSIGDPTVNQALSRSRATTVKDALEAQGVPSDRVEVSGQGVSETAGNDTEQGRAVNRRVEIVVVSR